MESVEDGHPGSVISVAHIHRHTCKTNPGFPFCSSERKPFFGLTLVAQRHTTLILNSAQSSSSTDCIQFTLIQSVSENDDQQS